MGLYKVDETTADLTKVAGGTLYADNPIGSILPYGGAIAPSGWFICQGQAISRTTYAELFTVIGTAFGTGDGSTTFNLPDLRNKAVMGAGTTGVLGASQSAQLPNITGKIDNKSGTFGIMGFSSGTNSFSGALIGSEAKGAVYTGQQNTSACKVVTFDASHSGASTDINGNNVYKNNGETRPANVRLNFIIKAKHTPVPTDFLDVVDDIIKDTTVDAVTNGDMNPVTSNAVYDEFKRVQSQTYECSGYLINSIAGEIEGYGRATVTLKDGIAEIKFSARIHTNTMSSTFRWGLNRDLLRTLLPNLPNITPIGNYSNLQFFAGTGAVLVDLMGYGAIASADNQFWVPARMYQINGSTGVWGSDQFPTNSYITGTVYGIYTA